ncbi:hypothetical protein [Schumannella soli]|uniref:Uncharacterized protein n=1 Tax=Schumannella soli TaxID=2590779 RepID=A0A506Y2R8_9MICO|nr:hypothetical protein [Schumannella soli]TPW75900.1 hypothetical protein FJ657_08615 [Schumannella soli]
MGGFDIWAPDATLGSVDATLSGKSLEQVDLLFARPLSTSEGVTFDFEDALTFDLGVRRVATDEKTGRPTLTLASDEALLQDYRRIEPTVFDPVQQQPGGAVSQPGSVLDAVNRALAVVGEQIGDVSFTVPISVLHNHSFEVDAENWRPLDSRFAVSQSTVTSRSGTGSLRVAYNTAIPSLPFPGTAVVTQPYYDLAVNEVNFGQMWVYTATARQLALRTADLATLTYGTDWMEAAPTTGWRQMSATIVPTTPRVDLTIYDMTGGPSGSVLYVDDVVIYRGGFTDRPSSRVPSQESIKWEPGVSAWDYIKPLLDTYNLKLWCDENRTWHLTRLREYARPRDTSDFPNYRERAALNLRRDDLTELGVTVDRDADDWFDAAALTYTWTTAAGVAQTAYDTFAFEGWSKAYAATINRPFPGKGAAEQLVRRASTRGRVLTVTGLSEYSAFPGMRLDLPDDLGTVAAVEFNLSDHTMRVSPRGLERS